MLVLPDNNLAIFNDTGGVALKYLIQGIEPEGVIGRLTQIFDVTEQKASEDFPKFIQGLSDAGIAEFDFAHQDNSTEQEEPVEEGNTERSFKDDSAYSETDNGVEGSKPATEDGPAAEQPANSDSKTTINQESNQPGHPLRDLKPEESIHGENIHE